jgi:uncharacterized protein (TIGR02266 family)
MSSHQRRFPRRSLQVEFRAQDHAGGGQLLLSSTDLSAGGAFLQSELLLEVGELLALAFQVPGMEQGLQARARVVWVRRFPQGAELPGMGVEFVAMREEDRAALTGYLGEE